MTQSNIDRPNRRMYAFSLHDKYLLEEGAIILSGIQALARLPLDQHRADKRAGLNTATLISGYRGSPVGGLDFALQAIHSVLDEHQIVFMPGVNEDLGATAIFGSQIANLLPQPKYDGVLGMWYGKGPGVDRTGDAFKHANITGVGRHGGVLALAGDDPTAKSSTIPSHSEVALYDAQMPVLYPGNVQEVLDLGRLGFELSRYTGSWVGFKIVTDVADEFSTAHVSPERIVVADPGFIIDGKPWQPTQNPALLAPYSLQQEREIHEGRLQAARRFAAANGLNEITVPTPDAWLGIVAAGKTYYDLRDALRQLGLDDTSLQRHGVRLLKIGMLYPLEPTIVREFARGLDEILVVEEKRAFVEMFIRDILYAGPHRPRVVGKRDEHGEILVRGHGELDADSIATLLAKRLQQRIPAASIAARMRVISEASLPMPPQPVTRTPFYCSGCPHNRSTVALEGSLVGGGIGCHTMAILMDRNIMGVTQMGGEGAQWVGAAPFTGTRHMFQNLGDGTLFHSGTLAIRQAVAADTNLTYKILYNSAVAMTGGQEVDGAIGVPELTRELAAEGVRRTIVVADDPDKYAPDARWGDTVEIWRRDRLDEAQRTLRDTPGVTVLIYDQPCAADLRRKRKRGLAPDPPTRIFINEAVCEGCGDCGLKSNCLSVFPVETEFGRKTQIHQSSCNKDYTCLDGDCPAFVKVLPGDHDHRSDPAPDLDQLDRELPEPTRLVNDSCNLYMTGIGGTGVVTVNQILGTAALLAGKHVHSLDQTGLSQKGGPVISHLKILDAPVEVSNRVGVGEADAYIVFDILSGSNQVNLRRAHPERTVAVVSHSQIPTGAMVNSTEARFPAPDPLIERIEARTRAADNVYLDAVGLSEQLFRSHMPANLMVIGAAYQAGVIPISAEAIERAIEINGVAVQTNLGAFRAGRLTVADPKWAAALDGHRPGAMAARERTLNGPARALVDSVGADGELRRLLALCVPELIAYQNEDYAREYVGFVRRVVDAERPLTADRGRRTAVGGPETANGHYPLASAVARRLFKLMAYKDEYEVARLHLKPEARQALQEQFGAGARIEYQLHPPFLRYLGLSRKIGFGRWFEVGLRVLCALRRLRGTPLDLFGYTEVRRTERALIAEYRSIVERALTNLSAHTYDDAVELAELPEVIRGYEEIKLRNVARFRKEAKLFLKSFAS